MQTQTLYSGAVTIRRDGSHKYFVTDTERGLSDVWAPGVTGISGKVNMDGKLEGLNKWAARMAVEKIRGEWSRLITLPPSELALALDEAAKEHEKKRDKAAEIGTKIHEWVEQHIRSVIHFGQEPEWPTDPQIVGGVERYLEWESQNHVEYLHTERYVYYRDPDHEPVDPDFVIFVGQADIVARINGRIGLPDVKSSNYFSPDYALQTAAYAKAYNCEFPDDPIEERWVLMIDNKEGKLDPKPMDPNGVNCIDDDFRAFLGCLDVRNWETRLKARRKVWGIDR